MAKSSANVAAPLSSPSKFLNVLPSTTFVCGHSTTAPGSRPCRSSAAVLMTLNVDRARRRRPARGRTWSRPGGSRQRGCRRSTAAGRRAPPADRSSASASSAAFCARARECRVQRARRRARRACAACARARRSRRLADHDPARGHAGEPCVVHLLQAPLPGLRAGREPAVRLGDLLGRGRPDAAEQRAGELARRGERRRAVDGQQAGDAVSDACLRVVGLAQHLRLHELLRTGAAHRLRQRLGVEIERLRERAGAGA